MFSATDRLGMRARDCKTNPTRRRRSTESLRRLSVARSMPPRWTAPDVGRSRPAASWRRVDLPDPDGPVTELDEPPGSSAVTW